MCSKDGVAQLRDSATAENYKLGEVSMTQSVSESSKILTLVPRAIQDDEQEIYYKKTSG
jgi:hypothetical protein